jgi:hypothetical protein
VTKLEETAGDTSDRTLGPLVVAYLKTVDSLRIVNVETTLEQREKSNVYSGIGLILAALSLATAATDFEESFKATLTGVFAAAGGLVTALNGKFRHEEDATISAVCSRIAEAELLSFRQPKDLQEFHARQNAFNKVWTDSGCASTQIRRGVTPDPKPKNRAQGQP